MTIEKEREMQRKIAALECENKKLKQQLNSVRLEKAMIAFQELPQAEQWAVRSCYWYIWENYAPTLVWEEFVWRYMDFKWSHTYKSLREY